MNYIEEQKLSCIVATRMYSNVKNEVYRLDDWVSICNGMDVPQMYFEHEGGKRRRYIVVRKEIEKRPMAGGKLLFDDLPGYRYSCYVTNMNLPLDAIWNVYNTREDCENRIKELKQDFGLESFCLKDLWQQKLLSGL